jgi:hypothetical protein
MHYHLKPELNSLAFILLIYKLDRARTQTNMGQQNQGLSINYTDIFKISQIRQIKSLNT